MGNAYDVVRDFEKAVAAFTGAPHAVAVESCSAALFLCCKYVGVDALPEVVIPKITYPSCPAAVVNAGGRVKFDGMDWQGKGYYRMAPTPIFDSAKRLCRGMYPKLLEVCKKSKVGDALACLSFHAKKTIPIGRGGMILTNSKDSAEWFKCARFDGRHECALHEDTLAMAGWNFYMSVEHAARGLELMQWIKDDNVLPPDPYQDLSGYDFFIKANR